jgi:hypothetical protein
MPDIAWWRKRHQRRSFRELLRPHRSPTIASGCWKHALKKQRPSSPRCVHKSPRCLPRNPLCATNCNVSKKPSAPERLSPENLRSALPRQLNPLTPILHYFIIAKTAFPLRLLESTRTPVHPFTSDGGRRVHMVKPCGRGGACQGSGLPDLLDRAARMGKDPDTFPRGNLGDVAKGGAHGVSSVSAGVMAPARGHGYGPVHSSAQEDSLRAGPCGSRTPASVVVSA